MDFVSGLELSFFMFFLKKHIVFSGMQEHCFLVGFVRIWLNVLIIDGWEHMCLEFLSAMTFFPKSQLHISLTRGGDYHQNRFQIVFFWYCQFGFLRSVEGRRRGRAEQEEEKKKTQKEEINSGLCGPIQILPKETKSYRSLRRPLLVGVSWWILLTFDYFIWWYQRSLNHTKLSKEQCMFF